MDIEVPKEQAGAGPGHDPMRPAAARGTGAFGFSERRLFGETILGEESAVVESDPSVVSYASETRGRGLVRETETSGTSGGGISCSQLPGTQATKLQEQVEESTGALQEMERRYNKELTLRFNVLPIQRKMQVRKPPLGFERKAEDNFWERVALLHCA